MTDHAKDQAAPTAIKGDGPDEEERLAPGDTGTNPAGAHAPAPAEGSDDLPPPEPGSPSG